MLIGYVETYTALGAPLPDITSRSRPAVSSDDQFRNCDSDSDGFVTAAELKQAAPRLPRLRDQPEAIDRLFQAADTDADQKLSPAEFRAAAERLRRR
jgi:Ca2+-binding EF-hand superfamily protein